MSLAPHASRHRPIVSAPAGAPADAAIALRGRSALMADLDATHADRAAPRTRVLAAFTLSGLEQYERAHGRAATGRLLQRLARRLEDATGGAGTAYALGQGRFAVLADVGRGGLQTIVRACCGALSDARSGVAAQPLTTITPVDAVPPVALQMLLSAGSAGGKAESPADARCEPARGVADAAALSSMTISEARDRLPPRPRVGPDQRIPYIRVSRRFALSVLCGIAWAGLSAWLADPWIAQLGRSITLPAAIALVVGIALVPGYLNVQLVSSLLLDRLRPLRLDLRCPGLTLLVAAYNEAGTIAQTIAYALEQDYPGPLHLTVVDDGSDDDTAAIARGFACVDDRVQVLTVNHGGKAAALNAGLRCCTTPLVATIDADTLLMPGALRRIVSRMLDSPEDTVAVAGSVLVRNSRAGLVARAQVWDYFLGIGSIKRQQALLQATLVAQGAFSVYDAAALRRAGGWPDCIGEDIVMTWALLDQGGRTTFEPTAVAFTEAPVSLRRLARQRRRWARGMIEGLRRYGVALVRRRKAYTHGVLADAVFPYLDVCFTFAFLPGVVLAAFGDFAIVGPMTLAVLPINVLLAGIMYRRQRDSLSEAGLRVRRSIAGFLVFLLLYQALMSPVSVSGYLEEMMHVRRRW